MPSRTRAKNTKENGTEEEPTQYLPTPPPQRPPRVPKPPDRFKKCKNFKQVLDLIERRQSVQRRRSFEPQSDLVPTLPDALLIPQGEVDARVQEQLAHPQFVHELCESYPDHVEQIQRLTIENELLKQQLSFEKVKAARLSGELSRFRELARRVLYGDKDPKSWDSRNEGLVQLVSGLLRFAARGSDAQIDVVDENIDHRMFFDEESTSNEDKGVSEC